MLMVMKGKNDSSKRSKDDTDHNHGVHLSHDIIIYDILTRIPSKPLNRFQCVCKLWSNLFHDPLFISLYRKNRTSTPRGFISLERSYHIPLVDDETTYNFVFFDIDTKEEKLIPFQLPEKENSGVSVCDSGIYIQHSFNGLLLISFSSVGKYEYFVYNLVTASWLYMGTTSTQSQWSSTSDAFFAYDPIISKYIVVRYANGDRKFHILRETLWCCVSMPEYLKDFMIDGFCRPVFLHNDLHWICRECVWVRHSPNWKADYLKLLRLDISTEKICVTNLPVMDLDYSPKYRGLLDMEGLLWFFHSATDYHKVQLWYLKKKNNNRGYEDDEWVLMCSINLMTEISIQQLEKSTSISTKSRSSPVILRFYHWTNCPVLFVVDPKCKIVFTYLGEHYTVYTIWPI